MEFMYDWLLPPSLTYVPLLASWVHEFSNFSPRLYWTQVEKRIVPIKRLHETLSWFQLGIFTFNLHDMDATTEALHVQEMVQEKVFKTFFFTISWYKSI